ncbi:MAG: DUF2852 domain-containing protein [Geminicoccaceae bacterium]
MAFAARLDEFGKPAWIAFVVLAFAIFWPLGLAVLAFAIGSGRMSCGGRGRWFNMDGEGWGKRGRRSRWGSDGGGTGNRAFQEYRDETLRRLEEEEREFRGFLERLRMAKDKAEFDQFMAERRRSPEAPAAEG